MTEKQIAGRSIVLLYDRGNIPAGQVFRMSDRSAYARTKDGAFVLINKDRRSVKERKRARRELRNLSKEA